MYSFETRIAVKMIVGSQSCSQISSALMQSCYDTFETDTHFLISFMGESFTRLSTGLLFGD